MNSSEEHSAPSTASDSGALSAALKAIDDMTQAMIHAIRFGSLEDSVSVCCQLEFARAAKLGMTGFVTYELRRSELLQLLRKPRGRKPSDEVTLALKLESEGAPGKEIYRRLGKTNRSEQHALSEAMRQRKFRQKRAQTSPEE